MSNVQPVSYETAGGGGTESALAFDPVLIVVAIALLALLVAPFVSVRVFSDDERGIGFKHHWWWPLLLTLFFFVVVSLGWVSP